MNIVVCNRAVHAAVALAVLGTCANHRTSAATGDSLDEIVVTATKRAENLQVVPLTVSVVSQTDLQSQNLADTGDLQRLVPDLQFTHGVNPSNNVFGIRGISTLAIGGGLEQSVGVAFDGVPLARPTGSIADLVDIHAVEVLKGPQGMLFGKNSSAGLINIVTNPVELGKTDTMLRAAFGSLNDREYSGTVNLPVTDASALRVSAWKFSHDGTIHEVDTGLYLNDKNSDGGRLKYRWRITDNLDVNVTGEWTSHDQNGTGYSIRDFAPAHYAPNNPGASVEAWELAHGTSPSDDNRTARGLDIPYYDRGHTSAYTGQADYAVGRGAVTAIVSYRDIANDTQFDSYPTDSPANQNVNSEDATKYVQLSEELRYSSPSDERLRFVVGAFNFRLKLREDTGLGLTLYGTPISIDDNFDTRETNDNYAAFGEATFDVTSRLHVIGGLRRSTDKVYGSMDRSFLSPASLIVPGLTAPGGTFGPFAAATSTTYNDLSWRTGLEFQFTPDVMVYATASRGYKGPGLGYNLTTTASTLAVSNNGLVKPEIAHGYEVGLKSQWLERRLTLNIALYEEIFDNFQTSVVVPGETVVYAVENAGQAKTTGVDLDARWAISREFSVLLNATYDNARYTDFKDASCYGYQTVAQGCIVNAANPGGVQNLDGQRLQNTPKVTTSLTARYERAIGAAFDGFVQANYVYRSGVNFNSSEDPYTAQGGYSLVNLNAGVNTTDGHWGVAIYGNNVFDKHYVDYISSAPSEIFYTNDIGYGDLQTFGIALTAHF